MTSTPNTNKVSRSNYLKSVGYLVEAAFRAFVGYMLLRDGTRNYFILAAGLYALATAAAIVIVHFVKAHK